VTATATSPFSRVVSDSSRVRSTVINTQMLLGRQYHSSIDSRQELGDAYAHVTESCRIRDLPFYQCST
jgi:hypothetical protein